jgi:hypothetical protein
METLALLVQQVDEHPRALLVALALLALGYVYREKGRVEGKRLIDARRITKLATEMCVVLKKAVDVIALNSEALRDNTDALRLYRQRTTPRELPREPPTLAHGFSQKGRGSGGGGANGAGGGGGGDTSEGC